MPEIAAMGRRAYVNGCITIEAAKVANPFYGDAFNNRGGHLRYVSWNHGWNAAKREAEAKEAKHYEHDSQHPQSA